MKLTVGILAHVDAGKTTLSEALLYLSGALRTMGRVDHRDSFLDTHIQEQERGITIFSKQALLKHEDVDITLLDTPGHADFSTEMERTLQVLDCAILVISGTDGVQGHTRTLWKLLEQYNIPTFIFINKMDLAGADKSAVLQQLQQRFASNCIDFTSSTPYETVAMSDESALEEFLTTGTLTTECIRELITNRKVFPIWMGSALKLVGVSEFLDGICNFCPTPEYSTSFGARIFKISRDLKNARLSWLKITGGSLRAKDVLNISDHQEKADQLRIYSGSKFQAVDCASPGDIIAVTGLSHTYVGQGLGFEKDLTEAALEPVLNYKLILPENSDPLTVLPKLRELEEEDPMLRIMWNEQHKEIHVRLMGQIQTEVLQRLLLDRFSLNVAFDKGSIVYKETIKNKVEGVGHFEPLRHYAEVHLIMESLPQGSGIQIDSTCSTDDLDLNWQRLIFTHLTEREHIGVLTGSPLTDVKITLTAGRAHVKHTEGGDFRQATYRAVRQGLMQAESILLEPFYDFSLELPPECVGRAMTDIQSMGGTVNPPEADNEMTILSGFAPVEGLQNYWQQVTAYTRGLGRLFCTIRGYEPCHNTDEVINSIGYSAEHDTENPADSVFCAHGGGFNVKWNEVSNYMHLPTTLKPDKPQPQTIPASHAAPSTYTGTLEQDKELQKIFERTYGKVEPRKFITPEKHVYSSDSPVKLRSTKPMTEYLLVDGYNIIFAWDELKDLAQFDLSAARLALEDILINYKGFKDCIVILVFDAHKVRENPGSVEKRNGLYTVYTKTAETADNYIERTTYQLGKDKKVRVATSDGLEQIIILGHGALRVSARAFKAEIESAQVEISELISKHSSELENKPIIKEK